jgi:hypothetical protein
MNTSQLKKFAQGARLKLLEQVEAKLNFVLTHDTAELRGKAETVRKLKEELTKIGQKALVDKVAYTWFNRLIALRFMDANGYQPLGISIVTPSELTNSVSPQILEEAHAGNISDELKINKSEIIDILDGRIISNNPDNDVFRLLLVAACNQLNNVFPFLFERINDYTELLLPDDLTSKMSIIKDVCEGMSVEDCSEVEIIGWLYQFYISEKKDELINAKKVYKADEIAPVTQLFTPKWIVEYMVDNSLGQYWKEARPNTNILKNLQFYIKPNNPELIPSRNLKSPEDIKFFDPCVGSAHILCYAFDIFYKIYEEEGYDPTTIPELIISKNLYGIDIDDRASQLAGFALMMKGRKHYRRFFNKVVKLNITSFQNIDSHPKFDNAKVLGSLIKISKEEAGEIKTDNTSLFYERDLQLKKQADLLSNKYDIVVTNPPYLNTSYMNSELKKHVEKEFKDTKTDLFACFLIRACELTNKNGLIGFISPYLWMFIQSFEKLREYIYQHSTVSSLIQLEYNAFGPAVVPIGTFVLRNELLNNYKGSYIRLAEFNGEENQAPRTIEAILNNECGWFFVKNQKDFIQIPGKPIAYWLNDNYYSLFSDKFEQLELNSSPRQGLATSDNDKYTRTWFEICNLKFAKNINRQEAIISNFKWYSFNKGGVFRRWYGNNDYVVNWYNDGAEIKNDVLRKYPYLKTPDFVTKNQNLYFKEGYSWTAISNKNFGVRFQNVGTIFSNAGMALFPAKKSKLIFGILNTNLVGEILEALSPGLNFNAGTIGLIPIPKDVPINTENKINSLVDECLDISKMDWSKFETSQEFKKNSLFYFDTIELEDSYEYFKKFWSTKYYKLKDNELLIEQIIRNLYGIDFNNKLIRQITLLQVETELNEDKLEFKNKEVFAQFISYAVGCMFGRYSLDKEGLILANQGESLQDYIKKIGKSREELSFIPDEDNIIPMLDDEWFEDDIVARFYAFLKASFGEKEFQKNLAFVEECLGKDIRKYFVKDFYNDHIKRYKKRPIYWLFSSPKGSFNVLIYLHRYTPDTLNKILNSYLREFIEKLNLQRKQLEHTEVNGTPSEQSKARKEIDKIDIKLADCKKYEAEILYPLASERIALDLDDGVLVNYNKLGAAVATVAGLNDKVAKKKVKEFDWIDTTQIR